MRRQAETDQGGHLRRHAAARRGLAPHEGRGLFREDIRFFRAGTVGDWRELFDDATLLEYRSRITEVATPGLTDWLRRPGGALHVRTPSGFFRISGVGTHADALTRLRHQYLVYLAQS